MTLFYNHYSNDFTIMEKQLNELKNWIESLEFISKEINYFIKFSQEEDDNTDFYTSFTQIKEDTIDFLILLKNYSNSIENSIECIDLDCDAYYLNEHEYYRDQYVDFLRAYNNLKLKTLKKTFELKD